MATDTSLRVHAPAAAAFRALAEREGKTLTRYLDELAQRERVRVFREDLQAAYARLRADPEAWAVYQTERRELEGTLMDGLDSDEDWGRLWEAQQRGEPIEIEWEGDDRATATSESR